MRVPLGWLRDYVDLEPDLDIADLVHRFDMSGTKVEDIMGSQTKIEGIVVAEVLGIESHPNADNLTLVEVKLDGDHTQRVVCGAKNLAVGDKVPLAQVGAKLPEMEITERKIRGEVSRGMLCSGAELGISKDHSGILILQPDAPLGADVVDLLDLGQVVIELEVTPNRPDCMSMIGVAREVAALYGLELKVPEAGLQTDDLDCPVRIEVRDEKGCPRYLARYLEGLRVAPSPGWMASRLLAAGFRPISNIVDATNYVLLETGQPLHAFDAVNVTDSTIIVRRAEMDETITTLDGEERKLDPNDLMIADPQRALAIAGVMGGEDSEVSDQTTSVILESAMFDKTSVAFTSRRHGLRTEASARFERGSDPDAIPYAAARAARFMKEMGGGSVSRAEPDFYPTPAQREIITLRPQRTDALLGLEIPAEKQIAHLRSLGLEVERADDVIEVTVPPFRRDLKIEADLIEEVARLEGFDRLPSTLPAGPAGGLTAAQNTDRLLRRAMVSAGVTEAWTSSFSSPADLDALGYEEDHPGRYMVELENPMLDHEPALRTTLIPGLMRSVALNYANHRPIGVALFEMARVYQPRDEFMAEEAEVLGAVFSGNRRPQRWSGPAEPWDFFAARGVLENALQSLSISGVRLEHTSQAPFHPTRGAIVLLDGEPAGMIGEVHPDVCGRFEVPEGAVMLEVSVDAMRTAQPARKQATDLPRFPSAYIDLAFVVDEQTPAASVEDVILQAGAPEVAALRLFDLYVGEQVPPGKKSLAFALELRSPTKTLGEDDVTSVRDRIVAAAAESVGATLRA